MLRMRMEMWSNIAGNSLTTLWLLEPTQSTWQQLNSVVSIVLPTPCKRFWENFEARNRQDDAEDEGGNVHGYCGQLSHCSLIVLPAPCRRFSENVKMRTYTATDVQCSMIQNRQHLDILGKPILEPRSQRLFFGVRRCHAARRLQYFKFAHEISVHNGSYAFPNELMRFPNEAKPIWVEIQKHC